MSRSSDRSTSSAHTDSGTADRWSEAQRLFEQALDEPTAERIAFVHSVAKDRPWLAEAVLELLRLDEGSSPLDQPLERFGERAAPRRAHQAGDRLGKYRLREQIGAGGMGSVFRAERIDGQVHQDVAVKVLHSPLEAENRRRFLQEQRILAAFNHPRIARFLDVDAAPSGATYLVMELVEGTPVTDFADRQRLSVDDRIRLVLQVCSAVDYAHRRLVVHRDLKPSNILVTRDGEVRLIDFGIAKMLDPGEHLGGGATHAGSWVMTPNYASPEQLLRRPITTGTDIWALGVLLFEMLVGVRPFEWADKSPVEVERQLELSLPPKASARLPAPQAGGREIARRRSLEYRRLQRRLRGDLDQILNKALAFQSEQHYDSVAELANDLTRYLLGHPVQARPQSLMYVTGKFLRRHALAAVTVTLLTLSTTALAILQTAHFQRSQAQREVVRQERDKARLMGDLLADVLDLADPRSSPELNQAARILLDRGTERILLEFQDQPEAKVDLMTRIGTIYEGLGHYEQAEELLTKAVAICEEHRGLNHPQTARALDALGYLYHKQRDPRAVETLRHALEVGTRVHGDSHPNVAKTQTHLAASLRSKDADDEAEALLRRAVAIYRQLQMEETLEAGVSMADLAALLGRRGERLEAIRLFDQALEIHRAALGERSSQVGIILNRKAGLFQERPVAEEGTRLLHAAIEILQEVLGDSHPLVATSLNNLAGTYLLLGDFERAERLQLQAWERDRQRLGEEHPSTLDDRRGLAAILRELGRLEAAEAHLSESLQALVQVVEQDHPLVIAMRNDLAEILMERTHLDSADQQLELAYEAGKSRYRDGHWSTGHTELLRAELALRQGSFEIARTHAERALETLQQRDIGRERWRLAAAQSSLGAALSALGHEPEAEELLSDAATQLRELRGPMRVTRLAENRLREVRDGAP